MMLDLQGGTMIWIVLLLLVIAAIIGYACFWVKHPVHPDAYPWLKRREQKTVDELVDEVLAQMSLEEKVGQLSGDGGFPYLLRLGINVLLLGRFPNTYSGRNTRLQIPPFSFSDGPRGVVVGRATCFPVAMARAASWDVDLERRVGHAIGREVRAVGANYFAGLCINLLRHPGWGRAQECYGEDPHLTGEMAAALLQAVQHHQVMVCAKHFAVNSIENSRFYVDVNVDKRALHEVYLPHFKRCVDAGVASLMSAYNRLNGEYCGHNQYLLDEVLRKQWGFQGFVSSDWLWGIYETKKPVIAGMDVEMPYGRHYGRSLVKAVRRGDIEEALVDRNVKRVLRTKLDFISRPDHESYGPGLLHSDAHRKLAQEVAEKSMVLLKNDQQLLPLNVSSVRRIAVIGELATEHNLGDHGSSRVSPPAVVTILDGLQQYTAKHASGMEIVFHDGKNLTQACQLARDSEVVIIVAGYRHNDEGENLASNHKPGGTHKPAIGGDRMSLSLHAHEIEMIRAVAVVNANSVVTLIGGSAIVTSEWDEQVRAILMAWYPGMEGGHAFSRILFGEVNPSGRLPFSVPKSQQDLVPFEPFAETAHYGYFHGYTHLDKRNIPAAYPFGFGLSYTSFSYRMLSLDAETISVDDVLTVGVLVKNTGEKAGEEVVQLYIGFDQIEKSSGIEQPLKLLRGFRKVVLEPGEETTVSFEISADDLERFDPVSERWMLGSGRYSVQAGGLAAHFGVE